MSSEILLMYGKTKIFLLLSMESLFSFLSSEFEVDGFLLVLTNDFNLSYLIKDKIKRVAVVKQ